MNERAVLTERVGAVGVLTLSRPAAQNAMSLQLARELLEDPVLSAREAEAIAATGTTADFQEGVAAFLVKRPPTFTGR